MKRILTALVLSCATFARADSVEQTFAPHGQLILTPMVTAPFPHAARAEGYKYKDKVYPEKEHYRDRTVAIFIPKHFRETGRTDLVIHFHGWNNTVAGTLSSYKLPEQLIESGKNAILVVPEGPHNAPDSFGGKFEDADGFKRFIRELTAMLKARKVFKKDFTVGDIILSGHSGGYRVISAILDRGGMSSSVKEVWLFDALYAEADKFLAWSEREPGRLLNIYTDGGGTKDDSEAMMDLLKKRGTPFLAAEESKLTPDQLKTNELVFIHTDLGHNDVVEKRRQFATFLKTSFLSDTTSGP